MSDRTCSVADCDSPHYCKGYCCKHYNRVRLYGRVERLRRPTLEERFWSRFEKTETCWLWTAGKYASGYANLAGKYYAHRYAYELLVGPIPEGHQLDHTCFVRHCVNPAHLRPVTNKQNNEHMTLRASNTTGYQGVCLNRRVNRYIAYVTHEGKRHYLGYYKTAAEAGEAARLKRLELFTHNDLDRTA